MSPVFVSWQNWGLFQYPSASSVLVEASPPPTPACREVHRESLAVCLHSLASMPCVSWTLRERSSEKAAEQNSEIHISLSTWILDPLHLGGMCHLLATASQEPRGRILHQSPASSPTSPLKGESALLWLKGKNQINLSDTTANVNSLPCLS